MCKGGGIGAAMAAPVFPKKKWRQAILMWHAHCPRPHLTLGHIRVRMPSAWMNINESWIAIIYHEYLIYFMNIN